MNSIKLLVGLVGTCLPKYKGDTCHRGRIWDGTVKGVLIITKAPFSVPSLIFSWWCAPFFYFSKGVLDMSAIMYERSMDTTSQTNVGEQAKISYSKDFTSKKSSFIYPEWRIWRKAQIRAIWVSGFKFCRTYLLNAVNDRCKHLLEHYSSTVTSSMHVISRVSRFIHILNLYLATAKLIQTLVSDLSELRLCAYQRNARL